MWHPASSTANRELTTVRSRKFSQSHSILEIVTRMCVWVWKYVWSAVESSLWARLLSTELKIVTFPQHYATLCTTIITRNELYIFEIIWANILALILRSPKKPPKLPLIFDIDWTVWSIKSSSLWKWQGVQGWRSTSYCWIPWNIAIHTGKDWLNRQMLYSSHGKAWLDEN